MHDRKYLRECPEIARQSLATRGEEFARKIDRFLEIDVERRRQQTELDELRSERNSASKEIGQLMKEGRKAEAEDRKSYTRTVNARIEQLEAQHGMLADEEEEILLGLPNFPDPSIPVGPEGNQVEIKLVGEPKQFSYPARDHMELCQNLHLANFEAGSRITGSGFPVMHGNGAVLQRALIMLMSDIHVLRHGYTELRVPFMVHPRSPLGTGQLPKFGSEMYHVYVDKKLNEEDGEGGPHYYLIPTAEVPVVNYYREQILEQPSFPIKFMAYSPCWRVEAGSYGKDAKGLTRLHQFEKVELVRICDPEDGLKQLEEITADAEHILEVLGLAYRRIVLPSGDMAFGSAKTYDLEVWCPGEQAWREVSSASLTTDWQSRRANIRYRSEPGGKPLFPHMLNASGLALPRLMIAVLETYQNEVGNVVLPEVLHKYMPHASILTPPEAGAPPMI
ncbi:MAG: serine--tRNA ligase [Planctomycetales bacterium]|nr:serine--tRNA ligase [bacterium]UNM07346.1 MAG: serine--tRNA ligase [Planctomycetales bacterium]